MNSMLLGIIAAGLVILFYYLIRGKSGRFDEPPAMNKSGRPSELFPGQEDNPIEALTSQVRYEDVEVQIKRDFPEDKHSEVANALSEYRKGYKPTVYSIILHEAHGDINKVRAYVKIADIVGDYRDLAQALISMRSE